MTRSARKQTTVPAFLFSSFLFSVLCLFSFYAEAQVPTAKIPGFVLKDSGGDVIGQVVGFQKLGEFSLVLDDPSFTNDIPIQVIYNNGKFQLDGPENVYYTGMSCSGVAYVLHVGASARALSRLLGRTYAVGPTPGAADVIVYRGQASAAGPKPTIQTRYSGGTCINVGAPGTMALADPIIDITADFGDPNSWTME